MEKQRRAALVYAGPVRRSSLTRLSGLGRELKFVKSSSVATASRAVRALRAGKAIRCYEDVAEADLILVSVPECSVRRIADELAESGLDWRNRTVVLLDSECESSALSALKTRGAVTASLNWTQHPPRFLVEGSRAAVKRLRSITGTAPLLLLTSKSTYLEAQRASREEFFPRIAATVDLFRRAGMEKAAAEQTAASMFAESIRAWRRAGRRLLKEEVP